MSISFHSANIDWAAFSTAEERACDDPSFVMPFFPHVQFCNANAYNLMRVAGLMEFGVDSNGGDFFCGSLAVEKMADVRRRIFEAINRASVRVPALREASVGGLPGRCRVIEQGYDDDQVVDSLRRLERVIIACQEARVQLVWG